MNAISGDQFYRRYILKISKNLSFENLFFTILLRHILYMAYPIGQLYGRTNKGQLSSKKRHTEAVFHLNIRRNVPPGGGCVFLAAVLWLCIKLAILYIW